MENWKNKVTLVCKRNNLSASFRCLKYGYERAEISCASYREMQAVESYFLRFKGLHITHWYASSDRAFEGRVYIIGQDDYKALTEKQAAEKARLENWWIRYHNADAETRRLMACGAIV